MAARATSAALRGRLRKVEAEQRWLIRSLDPRDPKDRALLEWLAETSLLGGVASVGVKWPRPYLAVNNDVTNKSEED